MVIFGGFSLFLFICLLVAVKQPHVQQWDNTFSLQIIQSRTESVTRTMLFFTFLGKAAPTILIGLSLFLFPVARKPIATPVAISVVLITILANLIKRLVRRQRPVDHRLVEEKDHSFPSAHAATAVALYGTIALNISALVPAAVLPMTLLALFISFLIGFSRVYLGIHYFTDVLGGWFLGTAVAIFVSMNHW